MTLSCAPLEMWKSPHPRPHPTATHFTHTATHFTHTATHFTHTTTHFTHTCTCYLGVNPFHTHVHMLPWSQPISHTRAHVTLDFECGLNTEYSCQCVKENQIQWFFKLFFTSSLKVRVRCDENQSRQGKIVWDKPIPFAGMGISVFSMGHDYETRGSQLTQWWSQNVITSSTFFWFNHSVWNWWISREISGRSFDAFLEGSVGWFIYGVYIVFHGSNISVWPPKEKSFIFSDQLL